MKNFAIVLVLLLTGSSVKAGDKDSTVYYNLPDSIKAVQFLAEINIKVVNTRKEVVAGIQTDVVKLALEAGKKERSIVFDFPETAKKTAQGLNTDTREKGEIEWKYEWNTNETFKLLIATAGDSAGNFSLYSGYVWLPKENKWKLIGTCRIDGRWNTLQNLSSFSRIAKKAKIDMHTGSVWCQRVNGSWKNLKDEQLPAPVINLYPHIDSLQQQQVEVEQINEAIAASRIDVKENKDGVYYKIMKEGNGRQVSINDTLSVFYRLTLLNDGSLVDDIKDKPAMFPLKRLIKGWQIGVPLCKVGGKIKLVIPSGLAYSIRTRSAKIPPNSILVFEIEVLEAR